MKKGMNEMGFPNGFSREEQFRMLAEAGFDGFEINISDPLSDAELDELAALEKKYGVKVTGFVSGKLWQYHLTSNDPEQREKAKDVVKTLILHAEHLACDSILVVPGVVNESVSYLEAWNNAQTALRELIPFICEHKINVCIENVWNQFLTSANDMAAFVDALDCEYINCYFDLGNVLLWGYPEYWIEILGSRIKKVHIKDFVRSIGNYDGFVQLSEGDLNGERVASALRSVGYDDYVSVEIACPDGNVQQFLNSCSQKLDKIFNY